MLLNTWPLQRKLAARWLEWGDCIDSGRAQLRLVAGSAGGCLGGRLTPIRARATEDPALPSPGCRTQRGCRPPCPREGALLTSGGADVTAGMGTAGAGTRLSLNSSLKNLVHRRRKHFHHQDGLFGKGVPYLPVFIQQQSQVFKP